MLFQMFLAHYVLCFLALYPEYTMLNREQELLYISCFKLRRKVVGNVNMDWMLTYTCDEIGVEVEESTIDHNQAETGCFGRMSLQKWMIIGCYSAPQCMQMSL